MRELAGEACNRRTALRQVLPFQLWSRGEVARACAAARVMKRRVDDHAAAPGLAYGKREVAIVAVKEAIGLIDSAQRLERRAMKAQAHAVDDGDLLPRRPHRRPLGEAMHDRAADVATIAPYALHPVQPAQPNVRRREWRQ